MALMDAILSSAEETYLLELREQLELSSSSANDIENRVRRDLGIENISEAKPESTTIKTKSQSVHKITKSKEHDRRILFLSYASVRQGFWADLVSRLV